MTSYMHSLLCHVPEMTERYGGLSMFTQQCLEKLNCGTTHDYFGSTNMMEQENTEPHRTLCGSKDHNKRRCKKTWKETNRKHELPD